MTSYEFKQLLIRLDPTNELTLKSNTNLSKIAELTASYCFVYQIGDLSDSKELRRQLLSLYKTGTFDFEEDSWAG